MDASRTIGYHIIMAVACALLANGLACSPNKTSSKSTTNISKDDAMLATECEAQLKYLSGLIGGLSPGGAASESSLLEVIELYHIAQECYLKKELALALELIEEAIRIFEERSD